MALIKCPECGKEISDRSEICIQCGFPIAQELKKNAVQETAQKTAEWDERIKEIKETTDFDEKLHDYLKLGEEGCARAYVEAGYLYESRQLHAEEMKCYQKSYELDPSYGNDVALLNMGGIYRNRSSGMFDPQKAFQCLLKSNHSDAFILLGLMYDPNFQDDGFEKYKDKSKAIQYYQKVISLGKAESNIYNNLGVLYGSQSDNNCVLAACYCLLAMRMNPSSQSAPKNYNFFIQKVRNKFPYFEEYIQEIKTANDIDPMINRVNEAYKAVTESHKIHCPNCNSTKIDQISSINRALSIAFWGFASSKIGKQYKCRNCGYQW